MIKHIIIYVTFLSSTEASVVFSISFSHNNTSLSRRCFLYEQFLISKYLKIIFACLLTLTATRTRIAHIIIFTKIQMI